MVSGFVTSPCDQLRMTSGDARRIRMELNAARRRCSCSSSRERPSLPAAMLSGDGSDFFELDFQTETLELLDEHVERFGRAGLRRILALDDGLVDPRTARDV